MSEMIRATEWDKTAGNVPVENQDLNHPYVKLSANLIEEELVEFQQAMLENNLPEVIDACADMLKVVCQMCYALDINPEELLKEVNDSNFSKFCTGQYQAIETVNSYESDNRYFNVYAELVGEYYIIKGWKVGQDHLKDSPKVLKAWGYKEFDASKFIKEEE